MDHYEVLGVAKGASADEIRRAFRKRAKKAHPDRAGGSPKVMAALNVAYGVLSDPEKRERYDRTGESRPAADPAILGRVHLMSRILQWIEADQPGSMTQAVENQLRSEIEQVKQNKAKMLASATKVRKALKKLKWKGEGDDAIRQMIESQIEVAERGAEASLQQIGTIEAARALLKSYDWEADPGGASFQQMGFTRIVWR